MADLSKGFPTQIPDWGEDVIKYAQLGQQQRQFDEQQKAQKDALDYKILTEIGAIDPTNTTFDKFAQQYANQAQKAYVDLKLKNPNASRSDIFASPLVQMPLQKSVQDVPLAKQMDLQRKLKAQEWNKAYGIPEARAMQYIGNLQYNDKGINPEWQSQLNESPMGLSNLLDPTAAQNIMRKFLDENYKEQVQRFEFDPSKGEADYDVALRPFQTFDKASKSVITPSEEIMVNNKKYNLLPREQESLFTINHPAYFTLQREAYNEAMQDPNFEQLDPEDQKRNILWRTREKLIGGIKGSRPIPSRERVSAYKYDQQEAARARREAYANSLAERRLAFEQQKYYDSKAAQPTTNYQVKRDALKLKNGEFEMPEANEFMYDRFQTSMIPADLKAIRESEYMPKKWRELYDKKLKPLPNETADQFTERMSRANPFSNWKAADLTAEIGDGYARSTSAEKDNMPTFYTLRMYKDPNSGVQFMVKRKFLKVNPKEGSAYYEPKMNANNQPEPAIFVPQSRWEQEIDALHRQDKVTDKQFYQMGGNQPEE